MEILTKSFFTYLDLTMDHFKISLEVREKFLIWATEYFEVSDDHQKKWSKVGKGIDYYTFKHWISKDNRFTFSRSVWPARNFKIESHYHSIESVLDVMSENSYEDKLNFYHALSLLALVDKKYLLPRVEFLKWTALSLCLEDEDCTIIREHVVEEFDLSFDIHNLNQSEKEDIYLNGVRMAYLSGDIIDHKEEVFLNNLKLKLGCDFDTLKNKYFTNYLDYEFSKNNFHSKLAIHKIGAVLLNIIGCDDSIDRREGTWFKQNLSGLDHNLLSDLLSNNVTTLIDAMTNDDKLLCYILGLEVSLIDEVIHKNEIFWLNYIFDSIDKEYKGEREISLLFIESLNRNYKHVPKNLALFSRVSDFFTASIHHSWARWNFIKEVLGGVTKANLFSSIFSKETYELSNEERVQELISLSSMLNVHLLQDRIKKNLSKDVHGTYGEMLLCEILKISFLDHHIDTLEDDFLRELQYRFNINEKQLHRVVFTTAFLLGYKVELSPRVNYSYL